MAILPTDFHISAPYTRGFLIRGGVDVRFHTERRRALINRVLFINRDYFIEQIYELSSEIASFYERNNYDLLEEEKKHDGEEKTKPAANRDFGESTKNSLVIVDWNVKFKNYLITAYQIFMSRDYA